MIDKSQLKVIDLGILFHSCFFLDVKKYATPLKIEKMIPR